jgi:hypothetical protein
VSFAYDPDRPKTEALAVNFSPFAADPVFQMSKTITP